MSDPTALYLYGLVALPSAGTALPDLGDGTDVHVIAHTDVGCAVSPVLASDYEAPDGSNATEQLAWVTPRAWRHHEVLRRLHSTMTVIPFKFGMLCPDESAVAALLRHVHDPARMLLSRFDGKDEWTLTMLLDQRALAAELQVGDTHLLALADEERRLPEGRAYFVRKRRERLLTELVAARVAALEFDVWEQLAGDGVEVAAPSNRLNPASGGGAAIARTPVLVSRASVGRLEERLASLEAEHRQSELRFELSGPLPPYSFVTDLDLTRGRLH